MFGFLFISETLAVLTTACVSILLVYFTLSAEDYRWHWRAFLGSACCGGYVFCSFLAFWATRITFGGLTGAIIFVGYSALIAFMVALLCGKWCTKATEYFC